MPAYDHKREREIVVAHALANLEATYILCRGLRFGPAAHADCGPNGPNANAFDT